MTSTHSPAEEAATHALGDPSGRVLRHLVITVHGIRTFGQWQDRLASLLKRREEDGVEVHGYRYGYFSVLAFMVPFLRWLATLHFRRHFLRVVRAEPWHRIDIVAHSFGTHLVAWALHGLPRAERPKIHTVIFSASVLKPGFPWHELMPDCVERVVNDCGIHDSVLALNHIFVLFTGMAGRMGFNGMTSARFRNRYFAFGHSGYFLNKEGAPEDAFMETYWIPLIRCDALTPLVDQRPIPTGLQGFLTFLLNNVEPIKLAVYTLAVVLFVGWLNGLRLTAEEQRQIADKQRQGAEEQRQIAREERNKARRALSESLLTLARQQLEKGDRQASLVLFTEANTLHPTNYARANALSLLREIPSLRHIWPAVKPVGMRTFTAVRNPSSQTFLAITRMAVLEEDWWMFAEPIPDRVIRHGSVIRSLAMSPDGRRLLTGGQEGYARIWDAETLEPYGEALKHEGQDAVVNFVLFSPDGTRILTIDSSSTLRLWNARTGALEGAIEYKGCSAVAFRADGKVLITGSRELKDVRVWDVETRGERRPPIAQPHPVQSLAVSPDGRHVLVGMEGEKLALLWDLEDTAQPKFRFRPEAEPYALAIDPGHPRVAIATDQRIEVFSFGNEEAERTFYPVSTSFDIGFDAQGRYLWAAGPVDKLTWWDPEDGQLLARFGSSSSDELPGWVAADAASVITWDHEKSLLLHWDMPEFVPPVTLPAPSQKGALAVSDDGRYLAVADGARITVYETGKGERLSEIALAEGGPPYDMAFRASPPLLEILHAIPGGVQRRVFDPLKGASVETQTVRGPFLRVIGWSDDFSRVLVMEKEAGPNRVTFLKMRGESSPVPVEFPGKPFSGILETGGVINHTGQPLAWDFASDGRRLAVATADLTVRVLDADTGQTVREFGKLSRHVLRVALSPQGDRVAFATGDLVVHVRGVESGDTIRPPLKIGWDIGGLRFSPDSRYLFVVALGATWVADLSSPRAPVRQLPVVADVALSPTGAFVVVVGYAEGNRTTSVLAVGDLETGLEIESRVPFYVGPRSTEPEQARFSPGGGKVVLRQGKLLRVWSLDGLGREDHPPEELRRRAWIQTGLQVVDNNRVERLSPTSWQELRRVDAARKKP